MEAVKNNKWGGAIKTNLRLFSVKMISDLKMMAYIFINKTVNN